MSQLVRRIIGTIEEALIPVEASTPATDPMMTVLRDSAVKSLDTLRDLVDALRRIDTSDLVAPNCPPRRPPMGG